jgi:uncharacterized protein (TIGR00106 family)
MLADLAVIPVGHGAHTSDVLAEVLKAIKASGLPYQLTPTSTCIEGDWDEVMALVKHCRSIARGSAPHVITLLRIEDDLEQRQGKLVANVESVKEEAGENFATSPKSTKAGGHGHPPGTN